MAEIRGNKVTFDPNHIVLTAGATSANETLMFCLAEQGEAFLLPTPYYPGCVLISSSLYNILHAPFAINIMSTNRNHLTS